MKVLITEAAYKRPLFIGRALSRRGIRVSGVDYRKVPKALIPRWLEAVHTVPRPDDPNYVSSLLAVLEKEKPDVLLPFLLPDALVANYDRIAALTSVLIPPYSGYRSAVDNAAALEECRKLEIPAPRIFAREEALRTLEENGRRRRPVIVVVKPRADVGAARGLCFARTPAQALRAEKEARESFGPVCFQEFVPGPPENMRTLNLLFDRRGRLAAFFTTRKLRQWPTRGGITALSVSTRDRRLLDLVVPLFEKWNWRGAAEVEFKIDQRTGVPNVIEINPRFWSYIPFPVKCGVDFPFLACRLALGASAEECRPDPYRTGIKYLNPALYFRSVVSEILSAERPVRDLGRNLKKALTQALSELRGEKVTPGAGPVLSAAAILIKLFSKFPHSRDQRPILFTGPEAYRPRGEEKLTPGSA